MGKRIEITREALTKISSGTCITLAHNASHVGRNATIFCRCPPQSGDEYVAKLPGIAAVDVFWKQFTAIGERGPVGIAARYRPEVGQLHFEAAAEIRFVGLNDAPIGILEHPNDAG